MFYKAYLILATLLLAGYCHIAGQPAVFQNYGSENGLSQNSVYAISQTKEGFVWVGTQNGLDRFDGHDFVHYKKNATLKNALPDNYITSLSRDADDNLWVGTPIGVRIYDPRFNKMMLPSHMFGCDTIMDHQEIRKIVNNLSKKRIWIITKNNGIFLYEKSSNRIRHFLENANDRSTVRDMCTDIEGNEWCVTEKDLYTFDGNTIQKLLFIKTKLPEGIIFQDVQVAGGKIWIGSVNGGLFYIDQNKMPQAAIEPFKALPAKEITRLLIDKQGNFWIGTAGEGLFVLYHNDKKIERYTHDAGNLHSIKTNYILFIFEDINGLLWIGTSGGGISLYDPKKTEFGKVTFRPPGSEIINSNLILAVSGDNKNLYIGTLAGGFIRTDTNFANPVFYRAETGNVHSLLHNTVYSIIKDEKGKIWLGTKAGISCYDPLKKINAFENFLPDTSGKQKFFYALIKPLRCNYILAGGYNGLYHFDPAEKKWNPLKDVRQFTLNNTLNIRFMLQLPGDSILLCTEGKGLWIYDYKKGLFSDCKAVSAIAHTVRHACYAYGSLWLSTDNGLMEYSINKDSILQMYNTASGLLDNVVYAVAPGPGNNLWISTNTGLAKVNVLQKEIRFFDEGYGLQSLEFNTACCFTQPNGRLIFGGINGINIFNPAAITGRGILIPPVITNIEILNHPLITDTSAAYLSTLTLPHDRNFINISFAMPNFSRAEKNRYFYKLDGVDKNWVTGGTGHTAIYTQLAPGTYRFHMRAYNSEGEAIESKQILSIRVMPGWWQTYWFSGGLGILIVLILYAAYLRKVKKITATQSLQNKMLEYEIKALHAQMNPHFIFNCLAGIRQLVLDKDTEQAANYINKFSILIRKTLEHSQKTFISIRENNEYLFHYIEMEQLRFGPSFHFQIKVADGVDEDMFKLPPMIVQPFVENAVWHGVMPKKGFGNVSVAYNIESGKLICVIDDDGVGIYTQKATPRQHKAYGIESIYKRLQLVKEMYNLDFSVTIKNKKDENAQGTKVILTFSYPGNNPATI